MTEKRDLMIARLAAAYRQGRLVPFFGAGMSVPACPDWESFIGGLEQQIPGGSQPKRKLSNEPEDLIRRANAVVRQVRLHGDPPLPRAVRNALKAEDARDVPPQTSALATMYWPSVLTSNYDDLFCKAWNKAHAASGSKLEVLGRSPADCTQVLTSLHASRPPILWALQGYVGELQGPDSRELRRAAAIKLQAGTKWERLFVGQTEATIPREEVEAARNAKRQELHEQLVVGHEEYRRVAYTEPRFRRAFAEVFSSCSFLFVGSSLADQYLLNLFGEVLEIFGPSPFPHYALVLKGSTDPEFLRSRLNTFVFEYKAHSELPDLLQSLHAYIENDSARVRTWSYSVATSVRSRPERKAADIHIVRGEPTEPDEGECIALGASLREDRGVRLTGLTKLMLERMKYPEEARHLFRIASTSAAYGALLRNRAGPAVHQCDCRHQKRVALESRQCLRPGPLQLAGHHRPAPVRDDAID